MEGGKTHWSSLCSMRAVERGVTATREGCGSGPQWPEFVPVHNDSFSKCKSARGLRSIERLAFGDSYRFSLPGNNFRKKR